MFPGPLNYIYIENIGICLLFETYVYYIQYIDTQNTGNVPFLYLTIVYLRK